MQPVPPACALTIDWRLDPGPALRYNKSVNCPWFDWFRPQRDASPAELVDGLEVDSQRAFGRPDRWLKDLILVAGRTPFELTPHQLQRIAGCLSAQRLTYDEDSALGDLSQQGTYGLLEHYHQLMLACRQHAADPMRWLLARPPLGAGPMLSGNGMLPTDLPVRGAKITALAVLRQFGSTDDAPTFERLMTDLREDPWTRCAAGVSLLKWSRGEQTVERVVSSCLDPRLPDRGGVDWYPPYYAPALAEAGAALIPALLPLLSHATYRVRYRTALVLGRIGPPAVEPLMALIREGGSFETIENAELALRHIAPRRIREARQQRAADARSLSRAAPPPDGADRGLSRIDPP